MICKKCHRELPEGAERCPGCGMPLRNVGYAGYQDDPFPAYDDPQAQPPEEAGYDEYGYEVEPEAEPIEPEYEEAPAARKRRAIVREEDEQAQEQPPETEERPAPNFRDPPKRYEPYIAPPEEPNPMLDALSGFPAFLRAMLFEPKTTLNTMLDRADVWSGLYLTLAALLTGLFVAIGLGTGASRVHPTSESGFGYALFIFLKYGSVGTVLGASLILLIVETLLSLCYLAFLEKLRIGATLIFATLSYALLPTLILGFPILVLSLFSPAIAYALTACAMVWSLQSLALLLREAPERLDDHAQIRSQLATLVMLLISLLFIAAFGG